MDDWQATNQRRWDELTRHHAASSYYDVAAFKAGASTLRSIEVEELGDVSGRSLLHLQCHFGLDTLSWARRGATVTGVDFSAEAIKLARQLADELGLQATFLASRVEDLPNALRGEFDIVFTSYGVLCWLSDLRAWARVVAHFLRPGGVFYMVEQHPFADVFDDSGSGDLRAVYSYFHSDEPAACDTQGSYADRSATIQQRRSYQWSHSLSDVIGALLGVGLRLEELHEFAQLSFAKLPGMRQDADGWFRLPPDRPALPLLYSLKAVQP
jgi:SAM-dependent methyltransferase